MLQMVEAMAYKRGAMVESTESWKYDNEEETYCDSRKCGCRGTSGWHCLRHHQIFRLWHLGRCIDGELLDKVKMHHLGNS